MNRQRTCTRSLHRALAPVIAAALLCGGCGQVSDMLGLSSRSAKASPPVAKPDTAAVEAPDPATSGHTASTAAAASKTSTTSSRSARRRPAASGVAKAAAETPDASNAASPEVALVDNDRSLESRAGAATAPALAPVINGGARPMMLDERRIYSSADADVVPARLIKAQTTGPVFRDMASSVNTMELIISKQGRVEEVKLTSPSKKMTDMLLLSGAKTWRFVPASKDGQPVRYRTQFSWEETP